MSPPVGRLRDGARPTGGFQGQPPYGVAEATVGAEIKAVVDPGGKTFRLL
ncbi:hypothetical protein NRF20_29910 [Streptomyces sp. R-74717]|nr:hypothetical protein [Streptomyces atratus]MCX5343566.1 hypothetical protein [Streptomyces atratus]